MRANEYLVLERAVEEGVQLGWDRAHKHTDTPTPSQIQANIIDAVTTQVCEWFVFEEEKNDGSK